MSIESTTDVNSTGSTSTIRVTVEETEVEPGYPPKHVDVLLHVEPGSLTPPGTPPSGSHHYEPAGIDVWWHDLLVDPSNPAEVSFDLKNAGPIKLPRHASYRVTVMCSDPKTFEVHEGTVYNFGRDVILLVPFEKYKVIKIEKAGA